MRNSQIPFVIIDIEVEINCLFIVIVVVLKWILNNYYLSLDHQVYDQRDRVDTQLITFFKSLPLFFCHFYPGHFTHSSPFTYQIYSLWQNLNARRQQFTW